MFAFDPKMCSFLSSFARFPNCQFAVFTPLVRRLNKAGELHLEEASANANFGGGGETLDFSSSPSTTPMHS